MKRNCEAEKASSEKLYKCSICNEPFEKASLLLKHHRSHNSEESSDDIIIKIEFDNTISNLKQECNETPTPQFEKANLLTRHHQTPSLELDSNIKVKAEDTSSNEDITKTLYKCNLCNQTFEKASILLRHQKIHKGKSPSSMIGSDINMKTRNCTTNSTKITINLEHGDIDSDLLYKCNICHEKFKNANLLLRHQKLHDAKKQPNNTCDVSEQLCKSQQELHKSNVNECKTETMDMTLKTVTRRKKELVIDPIKKEFECDICGYKTVMFYRLKIHVMRHISTIKLYDCNLCSYKSKSMEVLKTHLLKHTGQKPFTCNLCDFKTVNKKYLKVHLDNHNGHKRFKCETCGYSTTFRSTLTRHILYKHFSDRPYKCNLCSYESLTLHSLKYHMRKHTGEKPFQCQICDFKSAHSTTLRNHMRTHTGEKPFQCNACGFRFAQRSSWVRHTAAQTCEKH